MAEGYADGLWDSPDLVAVIRLAARNAYIIDRWRELFAPRVAVLGIGGVQLGPVDTTELPPADAAIAADWLGVSTVIAVHHVPGDSAPEELAREIAARGLDIEVVALEFGQTWTQPTVT